MKETTVIFSWRAAEGGSPLYHLVLTTEGGDSVWATTTRDTTLALPKGVELEVGRSYLWYVDMLASGGRSASTGIHHFRVGP